MALLLVIHGVSERLSSSELSGSLSASSGAWGKVCNWERLLETYHVVSARVSTPTSEPKGE